MARFIYSLTYRKLIVEQHFSINYRTNLIKCEYILKDIYRF